MILNSDLKPEIIYRIISNGDHMAAKTNAVRLVEQAKIPCRECFYEFDPDNMSVSGHFFQSALDDMLEEYGESVENNEKIGILMAMVKKLMG